MKNSHRGSDFDTFLKEEGLFEHATAVATKRLLAQQIMSGMRERKLSKAAMARLMQTSRSALDRLLDPESPSVTLLTLERAAHALGKQLRVEIV